MLAPSSAALRPVRWTVALRALSTAVAPARPTLRFARSPRTPRALAPAAAATRPPPPPRRWLSAEPEADEPAAAPVAAVPAQLRNFAIVAHVDHGKTTLVDRLLQVTREESSGSSSAAAAADGQDRLLDSNDLERERGITINAKVTRLSWKGVTLNVVDTPGHADFGGEVERVLSMVDGVLLLVDATDGVMSQTKFVLGKALEAGLQPIVVLNKADRPTARLDGALESELFDLFVALGADESQLDYPTLWASAKAGWSTEDPADAERWGDSAAADGEVGSGAKVAESDGGSMAPLLDAVLARVPLPVRAADEPDAAADAAAARAAATQPFALAVNAISVDPYLGRLVTGKVCAGRVAIGDQVVTLARGGDGAPVRKPEKVTGLFVTHGIARAPLDGGAVGVGDIVTLAAAGEFDSAVGDTIGGRDLPAPLDTPALPRPTLAVTFGANVSPLAGKDGTKRTATMIRTRLMQEAENNVAIRVMQHESDTERIDVLARGELQLGVLIETMRREGFEMSISPPRVLMETCAETGATLEPIEDVTIDVEPEYQGLIIDKLTGARRGSFLEMQDEVAGSTEKMRLVFRVPSRGLLGFSAEVRQETHGSAVVHSLYSESVPHLGALGVELRKPKLIANGPGKITEYALDKLSVRGTLFVSPGAQAYEGMVVGEAKGENDLDVNPTRSRAVSAMDETVGLIKLAPPRAINVEEMISYMENDEVIEVTPKAVRLHKAVLNAGERERLQRSRKQSESAAGGKGKKK